MRKLIIIAALAGLCVGAAALGSAARPRAGAPTQTQSPAAAPPPASPPPIVLSPMIPGDANVTATTVSIDAFQPDFDVYSWNAFIALNWPPGPNGNADPKQTIVCGASAGGLASPPVTAKLLPRDESSGTKSTDEQHHDNAIGHAVEC